MNARALAGIPDVSMAISTFFDKSIVEKRLDKATRKSLSMVGAFVRSDAIRAINRFGGTKRKLKVVDENLDPVLVSRSKNGVVPSGKQQQVRTRDSSKPGEPPMSQTGLLKKFLFFSWDGSTNSVVIGPAAINRSSGAPSRLEFGGTTTMTVRYKRLDDSTLMRLKQPKKQTIKIEKRPYMGPALDKNRSVIADMYRHEL